ncbi:M36 family metallopeptidase [Crenothrix sp.]|uniref:M36 family metallopeptidase n=1 Tax=Crenothrix sp. TaxID=3100433 RepID=UPI00374D695A
MRNRHAAISTLSCFFVSLLILPLYAFSADQTNACKPSHLTSKVISLTDCNTATDPVNPEASTRAFINTHADDLKLPKDQFELKLIDRKKSLQGQHSRYQKIIDGYPVYNGVISIHQDKTGHIRRVTSQNNTSQNPNPQQKKSATKAIISQNQAEQIALQSLAKNAQGKPDLQIREHAEKIWYPTPDGSMSLAWKMLILGENPLGDFRMIIDAASGVILLQQNRIAFFQRGEGRVFHPNPVQTSGITSLTDQNNAISPLLTSQLINVTLRGLSDNKRDDFLLKGQFIDVASLDNKNYPVSKFPDAKQTNRKYFYNRNDSRFEQVMVYHTIDSYQRYLQALGFNNANPAHNGIHQFPILASAHWYGQDLSFYRPTNDTLHFGDGGVDDAEDGDIILHEYGHAIQEAQNPDWSCDSGDNCEMRAMSEGFSDYIAADFNAHQGNLAYQRKHAACVGEWDATAYSKTIPACLRRVDSNKTYPDLVGEKYDDSAIWSRTLWDIRAALGSTIANQIILEHHYAMPTNATMAMAALEMLSVDAELLGGTHEAALRKAFCARKILSGAQCTPPKNKKITLYANKDSFISQTSTNTNNGSHDRLKIGGDLNHETRTLIGFNLGAIDVKKIKSAVLELAIASSDKQWGIYGQPIDIHPLRADFAEGRGGHYNLNIWPWVIFSKIPGVTWNCAADRNIINNRLDCSSAWSGGLIHSTKFTQGSGVPVVQTNILTGKVRWTVTDDLKSGSRRWIIKKAFPEAGQVDYYSREGAAKKRDLSLSPRLIITFK